MGKLYRETKEEQGGTGANQYTEQRGNNFPSAKTAEKIGEQFSVSDRRTRLHIMPNPADLLSPRLFTPSRKAGRKIDDVEAHRRG